MAYSKDLKYCKVIRALLKDYRGLPSIQRVKVDKKTRYLGEALAKLRSVLKMAEDNRDRRLITILKTEIERLDIDYKARRVSNPEYYKGDLSRLCGELYLHLKARHRPADSLEWHIVYEIAWILKEEDVIPEIEFHDFYPARFFSIGDTAIGKRVYRYFHGKDKKALLELHASEKKNHCAYGWGNPRGARMEELSNSNPKSPKK